MKYNSTKLIFILLAAYAMISAASVHAQVTITLQSPLPGVTTAQDPISYLKGIYNFLLGAVFLLAMLIIVVAGIEWIVSRGNPSRIGEAQDRIRQAVFGILILFGAILLLNTIRPLDLKELHKLEPLTIEKGGFDQLTSGAEQYRRLAQQLNDAFQEQDKLKQSLRNTYRQTYQEYDSNEKKAEEILRSSVSSQNELYNPVIVDEFIDAYSKSYESQFENLKKNLPNKSLDELKALKEYIDSRRKTAGYIAAQSVLIWQDENLDMQTRIAAQRNYIASKAETQALNNIETTIESQILIKEAKQRGMIGPETP